MGLTGRTSGSSEFDPLMFGAAATVAFSLVVQIVRALQKKEKGFLYLDTHAGRGSYDLAAAAAGDTHARTPEWPEGVGRLWERGESGTQPKAVEDYLVHVRAFDRSQGNVGATPRFYPGSPMLVSLLARGQERLVFCERQPDEVKVRATGSRTAESRSPRRSDRRS
eukprot:gene52075-70981_t